MWPFKGKNKKEKADKKDEPPSAPAESAQPAPESAAPAPAPVKVKESKKEKKSKKNDNSNGMETNLALHNLASQLDIAEEAQAQLSQDLQRVTSEKLELANHSARLQLELDQMKTDVDDLRSQLEQAQQEKWEVNALNTDLQQRLQQTITMAHMQAEGNQSRVQEELGRLIGQLEEERQVTAKLSRSLELEKRKVESLEQKAKGGGNKNKEGSRRRSSLLPEEVRDCELKLSTSMELYRQRCHNLGVSLGSLQEKLDSNSWQSDLSTEINKLRKLLSEEKRACGLEGEKLKEVHHLFEQVYHDYLCALETLKSAHQEKKNKLLNHHQAFLDNIKENNMRDNVDTLTAKLLQAEESLNREKLLTSNLQDRLNQAEGEFDSVAVLKAQVEVYRSDFNAEREARERIAGEKADLMEEIRKLKANRKPLEEMVAPGPHEPTNQNGFPAQWAAVHDNNRNRLNDFAERNFTNRVDRMQPKANRAAPGEGTEGEFACPKCNREFRNTTLLTRHVNECLDRDF